MMKTKICNKCNVEKELSIDNFYASNTTKGWWRNTCIECKRKRYEFIKNLSKEEYKLYVKECAEIRKEKSRLHHIEYKKSERHKLNKLNDKHKRRQYTKHSDWTVTQTALDNLLLNQGCLCNVCEKNIANRSDRHLDHVYPLSRGWLHTISNLQWLCVKCNLKKWNRLL